MARVVARFGWICHAYCMMDNHFHLLIETLQPNLSRAGRSSCGLAQRFDAEFDSHARLRQHIHKSVEAKEFNLAFQELVESRLRYSEQACRGLLREAALAYVALDAHHHFGA